MIWLRRVVLVKITRVGLEIIHKLAIKILIFEISPE